MIETTKVGLLFQGTERREKMPEEIPKRGEMRARISEKWVWMGLWILFLLIFVVSILKAYTILLGFSAFLLVIGLVLLILQTTGLAKRWHISNPTTVSSATLIPLLLIIGASATAAGSTATVGGEINLSLVTITLLGGLALWVFRTNTRIDNQTESINKRLDEMNGRIDDLYKSLFPSEH